MTEIFYFLTMFSHPKSLIVLCPKIVLPLEYIVLAKIYVIISYYHIHGNKCPFSL